MPNINKMEFDRNYTVEDVLQIIDNLKPEDKELLIKALFHDEARFERLVKEDFKNFEATYQALA